LSGVETLKEARRAVPGIAAVFITAHGSIPSAVAAMGAGGLDYITKPFDNGDLLVRVQVALQHRARTVSPSALAVRADFPAIVGNSEAITKVVGLLARVAKSEVPVLIEGESGTGKELAARSIHEHSPRATGPFVAVNCGAVTVTLAESEFFGHERGAFTDARQTRLGHFELANGGTIFLDEIADLPASVQVKLLRVIQEREVTRVGGSRAIPIDVRIVAATNKNLDHEVREGRFREDLFWRISTFPVRMPPLRERADDVPLLIAHHLKRVNHECRSRIARLSGDAEAAFMKHEWTGNVREMLGALKYAAILADADVIELSHLPPTMTEYRLQSSVGSPPSGSLRLSMANTERALIVAALKRFDGNRTAAAKALGMSRRTLYNKLSHHKLLGSDRTGDTADDDSALLPTR
jgi:DNA-binding NtrC family response regulator